MSGSPEIDLDVIAAVVRQLTLFLHQSPPDERAETEQLILANPGAVAVERHNDVELIAYDAPGVRFLFYTDDQMFEVI